MTSKLILTLDEALDAVEQIEKEPNQEIHPNWYREKENLKTSVLASLPEDFGRPNVESSKGLQFGLQKWAKTVFNKTKKFKANESYILENSDLPNFLKMNPYIQTILLPNKENEVSKYWEFIKYLDENKIRHSLPKKLEDGQSFILDCNRKVKCVIANSTSKSVLGAENAEVLKKFKKATAA